MTKAICGKRKLYPFAMFWKIRKCDCPRYIGWAVGGILHTPDCKKERADKGGK